MRHSSLRVVLAVLAVAGCSSGSTDTGDGGGTQHSCVVHFTGGPIGDPAVDCAPIVTVSSTSNNSGVGISAGAYSFQFTMEDAAHISTGDFNNLQPGVTASLFIVNGTDNYYMNTGNGSQIGSFTLHITSLTSAGGDAYYPNGSLDATVPADTSSGASGTITVHAVFSGY
ncbi:MAG: hypothetical protein ACREL5_01150 [Gemmatimonadales bacterium]